MTDDGLLRLEGWARDGLSDEQIAKNVGINPATLYKWIDKYGEIGKAIKKGKAPVDYEVENALLKRALGYDYEEKTTEIEEVPTGKYDAVGNPIMKTKRHIKTVTRHVPGDPAAQIFWLKNRKPEQWRDKPEAPVSTDAIERLDAVLDKIGGNI